jgi:hypothetical protein
MNLIESMVAALPPGVKLTISDGTIPKIPNTILMLSNDKKKVSAGVRKPHTDEEIYSQFLEVLHVWKGC